VPVVRNQVRTVLIDLQGTILATDGSAYRRAGETLSALSARGLDVRIVTNVDSVPASEIARRLAAAGIVTAAGAVFSPVSAACGFLERAGRPRCYLLVPEAIEGEFERFRGNGDRADYVVVGDCRDGFTYERLNAALRHLTAGAQLIALQKGRRYDAGDGPVLDTGAFVSALEYAAGTQAYVVGKPSTELLRMAIEDAGCDPYEAVVVGDSIANDIAGAHAVGARSVLVRTGMFTLADLERSERKPDLVIDSVADLAEAIDELER
jgi:HAD superfamily hydrolase (TIGR01458 family)